MQAYKNLLNELGDQAGQHELIAENLSSSVVQELSTLTKQLKDDRRKVIIESEASFKLTLEKFLGNQLMLWMNFWDTGSRHPRYSYRN